MYLVHHYAGEDASHQYWLLTVSGLALSTANMPR